VRFKTDDGETLFICMRDTGFELNYQGEKKECGGMIPNFGLKTTHKHSLIQILN